MSDRAPHIWRLVAQWQPPARQQLEVIAEDAMSEYRLLFPVVYRSGSYWNADGRGEIRIDVRITQWRPWGEYSSRHSQKRRQTKGDAKGLDSGAAER